MNLYKKNSHQKLTELTKDLSRFYTNCTTLIGDASVLHNELFLDRFAKNVIELNRHAEELQGLRLWVEGSVLIHHMLKTPIGAPFVAKGTLLESANLYPDQIKKTSTLHALLEQFHLYGHHLKLPLLEVIQQLLEELKAYSSLKKAA